MNTENIKQLRSQILDNICVLTNKLNEATDKLKDVNNLLLSCENAFQITKLEHKHGYSIFQITNEYSETFIPPLKVEWFKYTEIKKCINKINSVNEMVINDRVIIYNENCYDGNDDVVIKSNDLLDNYYTMIINYSYHTYEWTICKNNLLFLLNFIYENKP